MARPRVLQYGKMPLPQLDADLAASYDVHVLSSEADPARFLAAHGAEFEYLVTSAGMGLPGHVVDALPNLRFVSSFGVGFDSLDKAALLRRGTRVGYTPGVLDDCVADLAFGLLMDASRAISQAVQVASSRSCVRRLMPLGLRSPSARRLSIFACLRHILPIRSSLWLA